MKDFLGNELSVGDDVVYISGKYNQFYTGHIVKFTARNVVIFKNKDELIYVSPYRVIKFNKAAKNV